MGDSQIVLGFNLNNKQRQFLLHLFFWIIWLSRTLYDILRIFGTQSAFLFSFIYIFTQMPFVYLHLYYLVPKYLNNKKYQSYILLTVASLFIYSYFNYVVLQQLPESWIPLKMSYYINSLEPFYDLFEGLFAFVITYALKYTWFAISNENKILELEKQNLELELNVLKAQVNPHFLFNSLNNIYSLSLQKSDKAPEVVLKLSNLMRYVLYECNTKKVALSKEVHFIYDYVDLEKIRHFKNDKIKFELSGILPQNEIEPFLLIPFVENAFKHGLNDKPDRNWVNIFLEVKMDSLKLVVENSLNSIEPSKKLTSGIGLQNVQKRLKILYPERHVLDISNSADSFKVELKILLI